MQIENEVQREVVVRHCTECRRLLGERESRTLCSGRESARLLLAETEKDCPKCDVSILLYQGQ